jgi:hypothetical protein
MNMRTLGIVFFAGFLVAALGPGAARAAPTTHQVISGTGATVNTFLTSADGCIQIAVFLDPATSISRQGGSTSMGLEASMFRDDYCNGIFEFGFTTVSLTNEFLTTPGNKSATLNVTVPIQTFDLDGNTYNRVVVANVQLQATSDTTSGLSTSRFSGSGQHIVSSGHSVSTVANVTGQISLDGQPLLPDGSVSGTIETSMSVGVDITK